MSAEFIEKIGVFKCDEETLFPGAPAHPSGVVFEGTEINTEAGSVTRNPLRSIDWGSKVGKDTIDVYFFPKGEVFQEKTYNWKRWEKSQVKLALEKIEEVTNLDFRITKTLSGADFSLAVTQLDDYGLAAIMVPPGERNDGLLGIDVDFLRQTNPYTGDSYFERGGHTFAVLLEEFGHGLGLAHPHDEGGTSSILKGVKSAWGSFGIGGLNQGVFTVMGYNEGWPDGPYGKRYQTTDEDGLTIWLSHFGFEASMMALDIAVLQSKYGANMEHATGSNTYDLPNSNRLGTFFECIWDAGGDDTLLYDGKRDAVLDLRAATLEGAVGGGGRVSYAEGVLGGYTIANGVVIENATGGSGDDRLFGNGADNELRGSFGSDKLKGGGGLDKLFGGGGRDKLLGGKNSDMLKGGRGNDTLLGEAGNDTLKGGGGKDFLKGGGGDDLLIGGGGSDTFVFGKSSGSDTIRDFRDNDIVLVQSGAQRLRDLTFTETEEGLLVEFAEADIFFEGVERTDVNSSNFDFG